MLETAARLRCAIYTRKSTECAKDQQMNSLQGQRAVCSAYIRCHEHRGWAELPEEYDDEGFSGKSLERPALHRLLKDAREGRIDVVLFYKIDRLTRSLSDFVRLMDALQHMNVSFVSVTQSFDTSDSMGRMVLNILLTFAQFEREMMGDRIRDKKRTLKLNGYYVGRTAPIGYSLDHGRLLVVPSEAELIRELFDRFDQYPSACSLLRAVDEEGGRGRLAPSRGKIRKTPLHFGSSYRIFSNPLYTGHQVVDGELVPGGHEALITNEQWDRVQEVIASRPKRSNVADPTLHLLVGLIYDDFGRKLVPRGRGTSRWPERYYESAPKVPGRPRYHDKIRVRAIDTEDLLKAGLIALLETPQDLRRALVRTGQMAEQIDRLATKGEAAAVRLKGCSRSELRTVYESILGRVEVSRSEFRMWLRAPELAAYLNWSGLGVFRPSLLINIDDSTFYVKAIDAFLLAPHRDFRMPYARRGGGLPDHKLVKLILEAGEAERRLLQDPNCDLLVHASAAKMTVSKFNRLLRLSYLAPDIKIAILDGRQPIGLTAQKLLYAPLPADWQQQRALLNFPRP